MDVAFLRCGGDIHRSRRNIAVVGKECLAAPQTPARTKPCPNFVATWETLVRPREATPSEREQEVAVARADLAGTMDQLRAQPQATRICMDEITRESGLRDFATMSGFGSALARRPLADAFARWRSRILGLLPIAELGGRRWTVRVGRSDGCVARQLGGQHSSRAGQRPEARRLVPRRRICRGGSHAVL